MRIVWLPEARDDIQRLYDFLLEKDPNAAERMVQAIRVGSQRLLDHPKAGRRTDDETGRRELVLPFRGSGYVIRYLLHDDMLVIVRVWHGREKRIWDATTHGEIHALFSSASALLLVALANAASCAVS